MGVQKILHLEDNDPMKLSRLSKISAKTEPECHVSKLNMDQFSLCVSLWILTSYGIKFIVTGWGKLLVLSLLVQSSWLHQEWFIFETEIPANRDDCQSATKLSGKWNRRHKRSTWGIWFVQLKKKCIRESNNVLVGG